MRRWIVIAALAVAASGCGMFHHFTNAEIPALHRLSDVMWAQQQGTKAAFKLIGKPAIDDAGYATIAAAGERLKLTTAKLKEKGFTKGPQFDAFADALAGHADELIAAAAAKDAAKAQTALAAAKATCGACHKKFK